MTRVKHIRCQSATDMRINNLLLPQTKIERTNYGRRTGHGKKDLIFYKSGQHMKHVRVDEKTPISQFCEETMSGDSDTDEWMERETSPVQPDHYWQTPPRKEKKKERRHRNNSQEKIFVHTMDIEDSYSQKWSMRGILGKALVNKGGKVIPTPMASDETSVIEEYYPSGPRSDKSRSQLHLHLHIHHHAHHYHMGSPQCEDDDVEKPSSKKMSKTPPPKLKNINNRRHSTAVSSAAKRRTKKSGGLLEAFHKLLLKPLLTPDEDDDAELHRLEALLRERRARLYRFNHQLKPLSDRDRIVHETMLSEIKQALADIKHYRQQHRQLHLHQEEVP